MAGSYRNKARQDFEGLQATCETISFKNRKNNFFLIWVLFVYEGHSGNDTNIDFKV